MAFFIIRRDIAHYKHIEEININMLVMLKTFAYICQNNKPKCNKSRLAPIFFHQAICT